MPIENDIILIYWEDEPLTYARIEQIMPDAKKDWYQITMLFLQIPSQLVTWILKDIYIEGEEFQMGGHKVRLEAVLSFIEKPPVGETENTFAPTPKKGKILSFPGGSSTK